MAALSVEEQLVRQAREDAKRFYADVGDHPHIAYEHTYGTVRVRVLRDGDVLAFMPAGHAFGDPVWRSGPEPATGSR
jgi:hypothetical protein